MSNFFICIHLLKVYLVKSRVVSEFWYLGSAKKLVFLAIMKKSLVEVALETHFSTAIQKPRFRVPDLSLKLNMHIDKNRYI